MVGQRPALMARYSCGTIAKAAERRILVSAVALDDGIRKEKVAS
jgi:hypothetical protein